MRGELKMDGSIHGYLSTTGPSTPKPNMHEVRLSLGEKLYVECKLPYGNNFCKNYCENYKWCWHNPKKRLIIDKVRL